MIYKRILLVSSALSTALILSWILYYSNYGIDFTDESFYLVWMSNPFLYDWSVTQFGFIYHPLYLLLDGDIASIRQANISITFVLSWVLVTQLLNTVGPVESTQKITQIIVAAGFAVASLIVFDYWVSTPGYNSLAFQALLISSIGLLLSDKTSTRKSIAGWLLIGLGGALTFMAKPSTALALTVTVATYLILARKLSIQLILIAIISALITLLLCAFAIDGSIFKFIDRLRTGIEFAGYLEGGHTLEQIIRVDDFLLIEREKKSLITISTLVFIASLCLFSERLFPRTIAFVISMFFLGIVISLTLGFVEQTAELGKFHGLMIWAVSFPAVALRFPAVALGLVSVRHKILSFMQPSHWAIALTFMVMPHIYAFGTGNNYWITGGSAAMFWLLSGVALLGPVVKLNHDWEVALPLVFASQAITATLLQTGLEQPYRQPLPLRLNDLTVEFGAQGSKLILSDTYANYLDVVKKSARKAGLEPGTPLIDLSGHSPGIAYVLEAESIGQAWNIGGYPGSLKRATAALSKVSCERFSSAWILSEPDGPRKMSDDLLTTFGGNLSKHYMEVASWKTPIMAGGYPFSRDQFLYKPRLQEVVLNACRILNRK